MLPSLFFMIPECVTRFPVSLWGIGGGGVVARCCPTVRSRPQLPQPSASVCNSSRGDRKAVLSGSLPGADTVLLRRFQNMCSNFPGKRITLDASSPIFRCKRSTSDMSCSVFCANRTGTAAQSGAKMQLPWQTQNFRCDEICRKVSPCPCRKLHTLRLGRCH